MKNLETAIRELTFASEGQYPRPFTTQIQDLESIDGLLLGFNQARPCPADSMSHQKFLDWHMGRCGTSRELYSKLNATPSRTRQNIERFVRTLNRPILESDVYCFSSPKASQLSSQGKIRGAALSQAVIAAFAPRYMIVFGKKAQECFLKEVRAKNALLSQESWYEKGHLQIQKLKLNRQALNPHFEGDFETALIFIPTLSPPGWNHWMRESEATFLELKNWLDNHLPQK